MSSKSHTVSDRALIQFQSVFFFIQLKGSLNVVSLIQLSTIFLKRGYMIRVNSPDFAATYYYSVERVQRKECNFSCQKFTDLCDFSVA